MYADVVIEYNAKQLNQTFSYIIPFKLQNKLKKGMKVKVPFGNKNINGFVIDIKNIKTFDNLKEIIEIIDEDFYKKKLCVHILVLIKLCYLLLLK